MLEGREAEAAAVAARLKAFQAHPVRMARLYTHGGEPLLDGAIVLRFAQGRVPASLAPSAPEAHELRCAKSLIAISIIVAVVVAAGLLMHDDEWSDRSLLQASLARLRIDPLPGADRPRYVGASAMAPSRHATDAAAADEPVSLEI